MMKNKIFSVMFLIFFVSVLANFVSGETYILNPSQDTFVSFSMPNTNYGSEQYLKVRSSFLYPRRALIKFDIPSVPDNLTLKSAHLKLYVSSGPWFSTRIYEVHRITEPWLENYVTWRSMPSYTVGATSTSPIEKGSGYWVDFDVSDDVRDFYNGVDNNGWIIIDSEEASIFSQEVFFNSRESSDFKPVLELNYSVDSDGDGYSGDVDCDDSNPNIHPDAPELCNNIDDDCDSLIDEDITEFRSCGSDVGVCEFGTQNRTCSFGVWSNWSSCYGGVTPQPELCNGLDDDCDNSVDEDFTNLGDSCTVGVGICTSTGVFVCTADGLGVECNAVPGEPMNESCNGLDDDCDGLVDEGFPDLDVDGIADCVDDFIDVDGDGYNSSFDCDDSNPSVYPGAPEICDDGIDQDCNGVDDPCMMSECVGTNIPDVMNIGQTYEISVTMKNLGADDWTQFRAYRLGSQDPRDNLIWGLKRVEIGSGVVVSKGQNYTFVFNVTAPNTTGVYSCDWQMLREGVAWFGEKCYKTVHVEYSCVDNDNDTFYDASATCPSGSDCDDSNENVYPGATEVCNGIDDDCDGNIDERNAVGCVDYYYDADNDGFGDPSKAPRCFCAPRHKWRALQGGDCDDSNPDVNPNATEICFNGIDNDCDGNIDAENAVGCVDYYYDADNDGFGTTDSKCYCYPHPFYNTTQSGDCDDSNSSIYPGAPELCDGLDNDCDGVLPSDELDVDTDGFMVCEGDCDDFNENVYPGAPELCDGLDNDCDAVIDEGCPPMNSSCLGFDIPDSLLVNETKSVSVTMKNLGTDDWSKAQDFKLGSVGGDTTWDITRVLLPDGVIIGTGENHTFVFDIKAPSTVGVYASRWQMLKEGVGWFGDICEKNISVVEAPKINFSVSPSTPDGNDDWYVTTPVITIWALSPDTDIYYKWDSGTARLYTTPLQAYEGSHTLYFYGVDVSGHQTEIYNLTFKVDTEAPRVSAFRPYNESTVNDNTPSIWAYYHEQGRSGIDTAGSTLEIDGVVVPASFTNSHIDYTPATPLSDGPHVLRLNIKDNAGNKLVFVWNFVVDTEAPVITVLSPTDGSLYPAKNLLLNVNLNEQASRMEMSLNGGYFKTLCRSCNSYTNFRNFFEGINNVVIRAVDPLGNSNTASLSFVVDSEAPRVFYQKPYNGKTVSGMTTFSVWYSEAAIDKFKLFYKHESEATWNHKKLVGCPTGSYVSCSKNIDLSGYPNGNLQYYFRINDSQGRVTESPVYTVRVRN